jgi:hypothetical protein
MIKVIEVASLKKVFEHILLLLKYEMLLHYTYWFGDL